LIDQGTLASKLGTFSLQDQLDKKTCIYDLIKYANIKPVDIRNQIIDCLVSINMWMAPNQRLDEVGLKNTVMVIMNEYDSIPLPAILTAMSNGIKGQYSKISRSLDTHTIIGWIESYNSSQVYEDRIKQLRENNQNDKQNELDKMYHSDMAELMKAALERSKNKPRQYEPSQRQLDLFKQGVLLYSDEELKKSIVDWTKRQRAQHVKILQEEQLSRKAKKTIK
jgi:hypothetical protein